MKIRGTLPPDLSFKAKHRGKENPLRHHSSVPMHKERRGLHPPSFSDPMSPIPKSKKVLYWKEASYGTHNPMYYW
jgi:hypothetical protein